MIRSLFRVCVSPRSAWIEVVIAATINVTGMVIEISIGKKVAGMQDWPAYLSMAGGGAILLTLLLIRHRPDPRLTSGLFFLNTLFVVFALFARNPYYATLADSWVPFQANKLGCLIIALLAPSLGIGLLGISAHVGSAGLSFLSFPDAIRDRIAFGEPGATLAFGLAGVLTLVSRTRRLKTEIDAARMQSQSAAAKELARTTLQVRDLMNSPLQTIELAISILRLKKHADEDELALTGIEHAAGQLGALNDRMREYENGYDWSDGSLVTGANGAAGRDPRK